MLLSSIAKPSVRLAWFIGLSCPAHVSFEGGVFLSTPSPCRQLSHPQSTTSGSDSLSAIRRPSFGWLALPRLRSWKGSLKFLTLLFTPATL
jgi:hypothetical protein